MTVYTEKRKLPSEEFIWSSSLLRKDITMLTEDPTLIAACALALVAGFAFGRVFSSRILGGCLVVLLGFLVIGIVLALLFGRPLLFVRDATTNLADYIQFNSTAFISFLAGSLVGIASRRRR